MIQKKKYAKAAKIIPDGYESANHFFEAVFKDKEMIWMGQNTNELHIGHNEDVHKAMIDCIGSDEYCKYPPPEGFTELQSLILKDLDLEDLSIYVNAGATESLYLAMNAVLSPEDNVITPDPGYLIIDNFASRFANEVRQVKIYSEENNYKLTPKLVRENMDENTRVISLSNKILEQLNKDYDPEQYGIEIQMVKIKKLDLPDENKDAVYNRMITERKNIAAAYKAQGESEAQKIRNTTDRETAVMLSEAEATADRLEAEGEAEYMRILSDAYNDPDKAEYYLFVRQLDAAKKSLENGNTTLFLDSDSPLASIFEQ